MEPLDVFSSDDLQERSQELLRDAREGRLSVITEEGRPTLLAVPFDEHLLRHGVHRALALHLFEAGRATLVQAARLADLSAEEFIELLGEAGVPAVDYSPDELEEDLANLQ